MKSYFGGSCAAALLLAVVCMPARAEILFFESFRSPSMTGSDGDNVCSSAAGRGNYLFPNGWLLRNVDNYTPWNTFSVNWINDAWEIDADRLGSQYNCVAFSTSYYQQGGAADDFMWTPAITLPNLSAPFGLSLRWRASAHASGSLRDGYQVRVMPANLGPPTGGTADLGNQLTASTQIFALPFEQDAWVDHSASLNAFAGQTVYIGFHNDSFNRFLLSIDDVVVETTGPNLAITAEDNPLPYTRVPSGLVYAPVLSAFALNIGSVPVSAVQGSVRRLLNGVLTGASVQSDIVPSLNAGAGSVLSFAQSPGSFAAPGDWQLQYTLTSAEPELPADMANNSIATAAVRVGGNELARHEGSVSFDYGLGHGDGGEIGVAFTLPHAISFWGVKFDMGLKPATVLQDGNLRPSTWIGQPLIAHVRNFDTVQNKPGDTILATTMAGVARSLPRSYELPFNSGMLTLPAGTYVVTVVEPVPATHPTDARLALPLYTGRYQPGVNWAKWPSGGDWVNLETLAADLGRAPAVSLLTESLFGHGFESSAPTVPTSGPGQ